MGRLIRIVLGLVGVLVAVVIGAILYLTLVMDPNDFRDDIERLAEKQGIPLEINGDLSWRWFPTLGLSVEGVKVMTGPEALLDAERLAAAVAVMPLFSGKVSIDALEFSGVQLNVWKDKQGRGNWEMLQAAADDSAASQPAPDTSATPAGADATEAGSPGSPVSLVIERLRLADTHLIYRDEAEGTRIEVSDLNLSIDGFDLSGELFELQQSATVKLDGQPPLEIRSEGQLGFNLADQHLTLKALELSLLANNTPLTLDLSGEVALETLAAQLQLALQPVNLAKWLTQFGIELPEMAAADALSKVSMSSTVTGDNGAWKLQNLVFKMDDTTFSGHAGMAKDGALEAVLNGDKLNLDRYLPVPVEEVAQAQAARQPAPAGTGGNSQGAAANPLLMSDEPLDLSAVKDLDATVAITLAHLTAKQLDFDNLVFKLKAKAGVVNLQQVAASLDDGTFDLKGALDARQQAGKLNLSGNLTALQLQPLLKAVMEEERLSGSAGGTLSLTTQGQSLRQWQQAMQANLNLSAQQLTFSGFDVERNACQLAALVNGKPTPDLQWKGVTTLLDVNSALALNGEVLTIQSLTAGVENLGVKANGNLNYLTGKFDVPLSIAFIGEADPERDCQVRDRWRNHDLPLRCQGSLDTVSAGSCGIDSKRINELLASEAKSQLQEKLQEKLQKELNKDKDKNPDDGDDKNEAVKSLLKGLLNKD